MRQVDFEAVGLVLLGGALVGAGVGCLALALKVWLHG